uniref:Uncharacterized protein n=1 Tax=uncultured marine virus TaxID=186617 RepID=A0A0F7L8C1_9VIRU|nr:hypothetical protein [uncultured marine virus]
MPSHLPRAAHVHSVGRVQEGRFAELAHLPELVRVQPVSGVLGEAHGQVAGHRTAWTAQHPQC